MPELSRFFGIVIAMFYNDHPPPHFHARYGSHRAIIEIESLSLIEGSMPPRALGLVTEWASLHRDELRQAWRLAEAREPLPSISPLE